jgi:hypothetical protein
VIAIAAALALAAGPASAAVVSPAVVAFGASPSFINLNRETTVTLEIGSSVAAGEDNYLVTVWAPDGSAAGSAWYNFTTVGPMSKTLGNASMDFMAAVTQLGFYTLKAEWWNSTSAAFEPAAETPLQTTDVLFVQTEFAAGSDPYADLHNCQLAEEFQRGDGIIARAYMRYASTGEILNGTVVPTAKGNVTGTALGATKTLNYNNAYYFWRAAWQLPWDQAIGVFQFSVNASDGLGNHGSGISPAAGYYGALKIVPAILPTDVWTENATSGEKVTGFYPGETVEVVAFPYYDQHLNHNYAFTNTNAVDKNQSYRVGPDRGGVVTAVIGLGAFNSSAKTFATTLATPVMTFDAATNTWRGTWTVPATGGLAGNLTVKVFATDGASAPNAGSGTAYFSALARPAPEVVTNTVYDNRTVYQNQTIEVAKPGTMDSTLGYGLLIVGLAAGIGAGAVLMRRGRGKSPGSAGETAQPTKEEEKKADEKKKDEGWG